MRNRLQIIIFLFFTLIGTADAQPINRCGNTSTPCWSTAGRPANPAPGVFGYNQTLNVVEWWDSSKWQPAGSGPSIFVNPGDSLQAAFTAAKAQGGGIVHVNPGTYTFNVGVLMSSNTTLECSPGAIIKMGAGWVFPGPIRANLDHYGLIVNENFSSVGKTDQNLAVIGCSFDTTFSDGNSGILFAQSTNVRVIQNIFNGPGNAIKMIGIADEVVAYNRSTGSTNACWDNFESPTNIKILYNYCSKPAFAGAGYGILFQGTTLTGAGGTASDGVIEGNTIIGADGTGIWVGGPGVASGAKYAKVISNYIDTSGLGGIGIRISGTSTGNIVSKNTITNVNGTVPLIDNADPGGTPTDTIVSENNIPAVAGLTGVCGNCAPIASSGTGTQIMNNHVSGQYNNALFINGTNQYVAGNKADTAPITGLYVFNQGTNSQIVNLQISDFAGGLTKDAWPMEAHPGYGANRWYIPAHRPAVTSVGAAATANQIVCHYGTVERPVILTNAAIRVTTPDAGKFSQVAVYTNVQTNGGAMGLPGVLIASSNDLSVNGAAVVTAAFNPATAKVGPFTANGRELWWCFNTESGVAVYFAYALTDITNQAYQGAVGTASLLTTLEAGLFCNGAACTGGSSAFRTWPATLVGTNWTGVVTSTVFPIIGFQVTPTNP